MDTKELVERLRAHTETVDMYGTLRAVDVCLDAADAIERAERELYAQYDENILRAEAAEAENATLRARVAKMEEAVKALSQPKALTEAMEFTGLSAETLLAVRDYINKRYAVGPKP